MKINPGTNQIKNVVFFGTISLIILSSLNLLIKESINFIQKKLSTEYQVKKIEFHFNKIYSEQLRQELKNFITKYVSICNMFFEIFNKKLCSRICEKFSIVKWVEVNIDYNLNLEIKIEGQNPICTVNDNQILGEANELIHCRYFQNFNLESIPTIHVENLSDIVSNQEFYNFVHNISVQHWQMFDINYVKQSEIRLYPKNKNDHCILLVSKKTFFNFEKISKAIQLYKKISLNNQLCKNSLKKDDLLIFDLRFKNSIVTKTENGFSRGEYEKKVI